MKKTITLIAAVTAMFAMSAASCDPVPAPVQNLIGADDPTACLGGICPDPFGPPSGEQDCSQGGMGCDGQVGTAQSPQATLGG